MNRKWVRVPTDCFCGYCVPHRLIPKGDPALMIHLPNVKRPRVRCQSCAGEAPPELPALLVSGGIESRGFTHVTKPQDIKREWMPYREPGEDDD